jgi:glutathione S-transferase
VSHSNATYCKNTGELKFPCCPPLVPMQYMLDAGVNAFEGFPNITAWWQRVSSRPTWQAALK